MVILWVTSVRHPGGEIANWCWTIIMKLLKPLALKTHWCRLLANFSVNFIMKMMWHLFWSLLISILQLGIDDTVFLSILSDSLFCIIILISVLQLKISDVVHKYHRQYVRVHMTMPKWCVLLIMKVFMVHHQLKFSSVLALNFMCTYAVHILIYSTAIRYSAGFHIDYPGYVCKQCSHPVCE